MRSIKKAMVLAIFLLLLTMKTFLSYETEEYTVTGAWGLMIKVLPGEKIENGTIWGADNESGGKIYITLEIENANSEFAKWVQVIGINQNLPIYRHKTRNITANIKIPDNVCPGIYYIFDLIIKRGSERPNKPVWRIIKLKIEVKEDTKYKMLKMIYNTEGIISHCKEEYEGINLDDANTYVSDAKSKLGKDNSCKCYYDDIPPLLEKAKESIEKAKEEYINVLNAIKSNEDLIKENEYTGADFTEAENLKTESYSKLYNGNYEAAIEKANLIKPKVTEAINKIENESKNKINEANNQFNLSKDVQADNPEYLKKAQEFEIDTQNIEEYYKIVESDIIESDKLLKEAKVDFQNKRYGDSIDKAGKSIEISKGIIEYSDKIEKDLDRKILEKRIFYLSAVAGLLVGFFALVLKRY